MVDGIAGEGEARGDGEAVGDFLRVVALEAESHHQLLVGREECEEVAEGVGEVEAGDGEGVGQLVGEGFQLRLLTAVEVEDDGLGEFFEARRCRASEAEGSSWSNLSQRTIQTSCAISSARALRSSCPPRPWRAKRQQTRHTVERWRRMKAQ